MYWCAVVGTLAHQEIEIALAVEDYLMVTCASPSPEIAGNAGCLQSSQKQWSPSEADIDKIAHICHEANRVLCVSNGDLSQPTWEDAPDWQKASARVGVIFHMENPYASPQASHDKWLETKLRDGWRYGSVKNAETKEHPCLLPFHALPEHEKIKDDVFGAIVRGYFEGMKRAAFN